MTDGYQSEDLQRLYPEDRGTGFNRGEFARDRARILHSSAFRRLGAKTQVLSPTTGDFARTRLTHSLEVAQVGREMATSLGLDPDVVDTACLAHDLGHPPFGHNGEKALNIWSSEFGGFEGNAQTLRLVSRLEPKVISPDGLSFGLNLTRASLDATCKYPWSRVDGVADPGADQSIKFGFYEEDLPIFEFLRSHSLGNAKCIEAAVMDFADDVAYSVHDFEDAIVAGFVQLEEAFDKEIRGDLIQKIIVWSGNLVAEADVEQAFASLQESPFWLKSYDQTLTDQASLKNLASYLIGSFVGKTTIATKEGNVSENLARYQGQLVIPKTVKSEIAVLKGLVSVFLMNQERRQPYYAWQRAVLTELADKLLASNGESLDGNFKIAWLKAKSDQEKHRVIVDQVASLTDVSALNLHHQLVSK